MRNYRPEIRFLAEGADHVIFSFRDGKLAKIAKLPKHLSFLPQIKKEVKFLEFLHSYCSNHSQKYIQKGVLIDKWRYPITICDKFEGTALDKIDISKWSYSRENIRLLACLLSDIHLSAKSPEDISFLPKHSFGNLYDMLTTISPLLSETEKALYSNVINKQSQISLNNICIPLHYDLGPSNFIVNENKKEFIGIIDFTNACKGDFHCDLGRMRLILNDGENWSFFKRNYTNSTGYNIDEKKFFSVVFLNPLVKYTQNF